MVWGIFIGNMEIMVDGYEWGFGFFFGVVVD